MQAADRQKEVDSWIEGFAEGSVEKDAAPVIFKIFDDSHSKPSDVVPDLQYDAAEKTLSIVAKGKDGWSDKSIGEGFYMDSTSVYKQLSADKRLDEVCVALTYPMKDTYGNVTENEVMGTWMSRESMEKVNWDSFNYQKLLVVVDGKTIYPQFVQRKPPFLGLFFTATEEHTFYKGGDSIHKRDHNISI